MLTHSKCNIYKHNLQDERENEKNSILNKNQGCPINKTTLTVNNLESFNMWLLSFIQVLSEIMDAGINKLTDAVSFAYWSIISSTNSSIYSTIQKWLFSITKIKKIQEPGFTSKPSEKPYFSCIFTLLLVYLSQQHYALYMARFSNG